MISLEVEEAAAYAIAEAKARGLAEVGLDEVLLGCLRGVARFGVVSMGGVVIDVEELGGPRTGLTERGKAGKVAYSKAVVELMDRAAGIAKVDGADGMRIEHMLVAFAGEEAGLMGELKRRHGLGSAEWRAGVARLAEGRDGVGVKAGPRVVAARDYLTPEEAAEALGLHVQTLRGYVRSGKLPAFRLAGERAIRIRRSDLEAVLEPLVPQSVTGLAASEDRPN